MTDRMPGVSFEALRDAIRAHRPTVLVTVVEGRGTGDKLLLVEGDDAVGSLANPDLDRVVRRDAEAALAAGTTSVRHYGAHGEANETDVLVFFESYAPSAAPASSSARSTSPPALVRVAKVLGYHVTVCDAREVFATPARFPLADEVVVDWPHRHMENVGADPRPA